MNCLKSLSWTRKEDLKKRRTIVPSFIEDAELKALLRLYKSNRIRTSKYSLLSFVPKNLFQQLHRFANVYFIFLAALNFVPVVEAFEPEVSLIPILLVMSVTAIKDIFEDYRRFKSDRFINNLPCQVYCRFVLLVLLNFDRFPLIFYEKWGFLPSYSPTLLKKDGGGLLKRVEAMSRQTVAVSSMMLWWKYWL